MNIQGSTTNMNLNPSVGGYTARSLRVPAPVGVRVHPVVITVGDRTATVPVREESGVRRKPTETAVRQAIKALRDGVPIAVKIKAQVPLAMI